MPARRPKTKRSAHRTSPKGAPGSPSPTTPRSRPSRPRRRPRWCETAARTPTKSSTTGRSACRRSPASETLDEVLGTGRHGTVFLGGIDAFGTGRSTGERITPGCPGGDVERPPPMGAAASLIGPSPVRHRGQSPGDGLRHDPLRTRCRAEALWNSGCLGLGGERERCPAARLGPVRVRLTGLQAIDPGVGVLASSRCMARCGRLNRWRLAGEFLGERFPAGVARAVEGLAHLLAAARTGEGQ